MIEHNPHISRIRKLRQSRGWACLRSHIQVARENESPRLLTPDSELLRRPRWHPAGRLTHMRVWHQICEMDLHVVGPRGPHNSCP